MPRRQPITEEKPKRGHLFDKLGKDAPDLKRGKAKIRHRKRFFKQATPLRRPDTSEEHVKAVRKKLGMENHTKQHKATKAEGNWTPRKTGPAKGSKHRPDHAHTTYSDELIEKALWEAKGLMYAAAQYIGMDYSLLTVRVKNSSKLQRVREEAMERRLDMAETCLDDLVLKPSPSQLGAICFFLKCQGKKRGYVERQETEQVNGPVNLEDMTDEQLEQLVGAIAKRLEGKAV
jgi:hypothetical protein